MLIRTGWRGDSVHVSVCPDGRQSTNHRGRPHSLRWAYDRRLPWCQLVSPFDAPCPQAVIFPPLPVLLETGCSAQFFVNLVLTILGWLPGERLSLRDRDRDAVACGPGARACSLRLVQVVQAGPRRLRPHGTLAATNDPLPPPAGVIHAIYVSVVMSCSVREGVTTGGPPQIITKGA
jgi:uncharacterized membrane protein YqaE (UPF0057 family)